MPFKKVKSAIVRKKHAIAQSVAQRRAWISARGAAAHAFVRERARYGIQKARDAWAIALLPKNSRFFAAAAYIPFVGWLLPLYLKEDSPFCQECGKQGFVLAVFFAAVPMALSLIGVLFVPKDFRIVSLALVAILYLTNTVYLALCAINAFMAIRQERQLAVPVATPYAKRLNL